MQDVRVMRPLVHCLTNMVTVNDCANALLAIGAAPVMADAIEEVEEIATLANAVVLNIGTLNTRTVTSMLVAGKQATACGRPVVLDPVGAGASRFRTETALRLAGEIPLAVIRGNVSEIKAMAGCGGSTRGVDADEADKHGTEPEAMASLVALVAELAHRTNAVVAVTGETDIVSDGIQTFAIMNGHPLLPRITGSGCMLSALTAAFCGVVSARQRLEAAAVALCVMGLAGEQAGACVARDGAGLGTFRTVLIDKLTVLDEVTLSGGMNLERFT